MKTSRDLGHAQPIGVGANVSDLLVGKLRTGVLLALAFMVGSAALCMHVRDVQGLSALQQMARPNAVPSVAAVHNHDVARDTLNPVLDREGNAVRLQASISDAEATVSGALDLCRPNPARTKPSRMRGNRAVLVDFSMKPGDNRSIHASYLRVGHGLGGVNRAGPTLSYRSPPEMVNNVSVQA